MTSPWNASGVLALRAALLVLLSGCGIATTTNAPKPVSPGDSSNGTPVAPVGLQLGFVWHAGTRNLYPILGVSGAARYGTPALASDPTVLTAAAATSGNSSWSLVLHKDGTLEQWNFPSSNVATLAAHVAPDSTIVFSPSGTCAVVASPSSLAAVIISGLPSKPQIATVAMPTGVSPAQMTLSDDGIMLIGLPHPGSGGVQIGFLSEMRGYTAAGILQAWGGAAFLPGATKDSAVVIDGATGQIDSISNLNGASPQISALSTGGSITKPVGISVSADGNWAFVADGSKPQVIRVSIAGSGSPPLPIACGCTPQQMVPLTADGIYSLTKDAPGQPAWLLDTRTSQPRTFFVPALPVSSATQSPASTIAQTGSGR